MKIRKTDFGFETEEDVMPSGVIVMWHGLIANIPTGWLICDGANGTPDLRAKFVRGAPPGEEVGGTGGEDTHILTEAEMPNHKHALVSDLFGYSIGGGMQSHEMYDNNANLGVKKEISYTGGDVAHENRPVYYELIFIKKT